jgi:hypothetical protein
MIKVFGLPWREMFEREPSELLQPVTYFRPLDSVQNISVSPSRITNTGQRPCTVQMHILQVFFIHSLQYPPEPNSITLKWRQHFRSNRRNKLICLQTVMNVTETNIIQLHTIYYFELVRFQGFRRSVDKVFVLMECDAACVDKQLSKYVV